MITQKTTAEIRENSFKYSYWENRVWLCRDDVKKEIEEIRRLCAREQIDYGQDEHINKIYRICNSILDLCNSQEQKGDEWK